MRWPQATRPAPRNASGNFLANLKKQKCDGIVTNPPHCTGLRYQMSWEQQRRIELRRMRVSGGGTVYSKREEAFYLATELGWTREQFMLAAQDVSKGREDS